MDGRSVPVDSVGKLEMGSGSAQITRFDRRRSVMIKADVAGGRSAKSLKPFRTCLRSAIFRGM
jgi:multidrug efflux pump subunit AcrB